MSLHLSYNDRKELKEIIRKEAVELYLEMKKKEAEETDKELDTKAEPDFYLSPQDVVALISNKLITRKEARRALGFKTTFEEAKREEDDDSNSE